jgi:transcriptional regulator with XRE-family HTH domain
MATRNTNGRRRAFKGSATALARSVAARAKVPKTLAVAQGVRPRQGQDVVRLREALGINQALFGRLTGYSTRTIAALENDEAEFTPGIARKVTEAARLKEALLHVIPQDAIARWLDTPNPAFDDLKPIELVERGHTDKLWRMIYELESGQPG